MADYKEISKLIKLISDSNLSEFKMKDGDLEVSIRTDKHVSVKQQQLMAQQPISQGPQSAPVTPASPPSSPPMNQSASPSQDEGSSGSSQGSQEAEDEEKDLLEVKSPIVGTFYRSSSPDKPPYAKVGDEVEVGDVVCIVEAMKLFNEIESEIAGKVVKVLVEDATPVEYDQALFLVDPKG